MAFVIADIIQSLCLFFHNSDDMLEMLHQTLKKKKNRLQTSAINFTDNIGL